MVEINELCSSNKGCLSVPVETSCSMSAPNMLLLFLFQCKLIVCQMSNTRCKPLSLLLLPMTAVVLLVISGTVQHGESVILYIWTAVVLFVHTHYGVSVVSIKSIVNFMSPACSFSIL